MTDSVLMLVRCKNFTVHVLIVDTLLLSLWRLQFLSCHCNVHRVENNQTVTGITLGYISMNSGPQFMRWQSWQR